jgi:hypothetical protein
MRAVDGLGRLLQALFCGDESGKAIGKNFKPLNSGGKCSESDFCPYRSYEADHWWAWTPINGRRVVHPHKRMKTHYFRKKVVK